MFGDDGRAWIATLPEAHATLAARWQLELGAGVAGAVCSPASGRRDRADGSAAILKIGAPWPRTRNEIAVLGAWGGKGRRRC